MDKNSELSEKQDDQNCRLQKFSDLNLINQSTSDWESVTKDSFHPPENLKVEEIGRRKMLLKKYFKLQALKEIAEEEIGDEPIEDSCYTEYVDNFCNSDFKPFMDNSDYDVNKQMKYPLYGGIIRSLYKEQVDKGQLKVRSSVVNFNQPFRKSCSFTMPPELALQEIEY